MMKVLMIVCFFYFRRVPCNELLSFLGLLSELESIGKESVVAKSKGFFFQTCVPFRFVLNLIELSGVESSKQTFWAMEK
jgi:hypothetical protein